MKHLGAKCEGHAFQNTGEIIMDMCLIYLYLELFCYSCIMQLHVLYKAFIIKSLFKRNVFMEHVFYIR